jgi:hypothetical protein
MDDLDSLLDEVFDKLIENDVTQEIKDRGITSVKVCVVGSDAKDLFCSSLLGKIYSFDYLFSSPHNLIFNSKEKIFSLIQFKNRNLTF